ncbi:MAG TPA: DNA polymerase III subunit delta' [Methylophilus sp.]|nr:DNA polymerase III subunit delta' [Methylophilus sp.]HQQ32931.1 DNA polymerase III subunit delta' [Methylophilus sp.]
MHYPWLDNAWQQLILQRGELPHAILLRGRAGIGKHDFAMEFAKTLLCRSDANHHACGQCQSCKWFEENAHPDFKWLTPEGDDVTQEDAKKATKRSNITVDQIRQLADFVTLTSHQAGLKIILISPAETLNLASANALLKMLEEPPAATLFILVANQPQRLLPTIISRCQSFTLQLPNKEMALSWLESKGISEGQKWLAQTGGAPLLAMSLSERGTLDAVLIRHLAQGSQLNAFAVASQFLAIGMEQALQILQKWIHDLLQWRLTRTLHFHPDYRDALQGLCKSVNLPLLMQFQRSLTEARRTANHPLNKELQLENLLLQYTHLFKKN